MATARTIKAVADPAILAVDGDLSDPATADRVVGEALESFGRIDTLVNNAGVYLSKPFTDYTAEDFAAVVGVNLIGFFRLTQLAITHMLARERAMWSTSRRPSSTLPTPPPPPRSPR